ncbi:biopolymer transporter Tol [Horticoccus sp. 23ND18S-11]|uniref:biopolymer transporter Tol n=1 Tax=Horticoccus sp. 23ND18S-11 TaxID=3391832 RepID=UPI0039C9BD6E
MHTLSRLLLLAAFFAAPTFAQSRKIGEVRVDVDANTIPVRVSANTPELNGLAQTAFNAHGRYKLVASGHAYDIKFTALAATQVRVDITKGQAAAVVASQVVNGSTARNALLRAADVAVEKTNGLNLKGFFTARMAFVVQRGNRGDIYVSDLFLGEAKQLTNDNSLVLAPRWAPDGSRVIYTSFFKTGAPDIFLLDPSTGRRETFASFKGMNSGARFSPSGSQVAMVLSGTGNTEIFVSDAQGRRPDRRTRSDAVKSSPAWSPDGRQIVFAMEPGPQLYVMPATGGAPRRLAAAGLGTYAAEPDWSRANPNKIACTVKVGGRYQIAVYNLSTGKGQVVSKANFDGIEPNWLADGRHLVYTARDQSTSVLSILDTETGNSRRISPADRSAMQAGIWNAP